MTRVLGTPGATPFESVAHRGREPEARAALVGNQERGAQGGLRGHVAPVQAMIKAIGALTGSFKADL